MQTYSDRKRNGEITPVEAIIEELGLSWSEPQWISTKAGIRYLRKCDNLPKMFWAYWKRYKSAFKESGFTVSKDTKTGKFELCHWIKASEDELKQIEENVKASKADSVSGHFHVPKREGLELDYYPFQKAGIHYAVSKGNAVIGDDPGLGKTLQAIGVINYKVSIRKVLITCPTTVKLNWRDELRKWLSREMSIQVVSGRSTVIYHSDIVIINYDLLPFHEESIRGVDWDLVVLDEFHNVKNKTTRRSMALFGPNCKLPIKARMWLGLSGTPIPNRISELWPILTVMDPAGLGKDENGFLKRYRYASEKRLNELQLMLRDKFMIRRLKNEVLGELPPKIRQVIELSVPEGCRIIEDEAEEYKKHRAKLEALQEKVISSKEGGNEGDYRRQVENLKEGIEYAFHQMSSVRRRTALAKIPLAVEHIEAALLEGPVVCFAHHGEVIEALRESFPELSVVIKGDVGEADRHKAVEDFQEGRAKLFIGSIRACSEGITLTAAHRVIFVESDWTPAKVYQVEDRAHRIGQTECVLIQTLVVEGSIEAQMAKRVLEKQRMIDSALDTGDILALLKDEYILPVI